MTRMGWSPRRELAKLRPHAGRAGCLRSAHALTLLRNTPCPRRPGFVLLVSSLLWPAGQSRPSQRWRQPRLPRSTAAQAESQKLNAIFDEYFEEYLQQNPILATSIGDPRYNDRFVVGISPEAIAAEEKLQRDYLARVQTVDRSVLAGAGPALVRRLQDGPRARDRGLPVPRRADPAQPVLFDAEQLRAARLRQRHAAVQDGAGLRQLPEAHRRLRGLDRPGHRQHARRHQARLHAAAGARRAHAAAAAGARRAEGRGLAVLGSDQRTCRRIFPRPTASA